MKIVVAKRENFFNLHGNEEKTKRKTVFLSSWSWENYIKQSRSKRRGIVKTTTEQYKETCCSKFYITTQEVEQIGLKEKKKELFIYFHFYVVCFSSYRKKVAFEWRMGEKKLTSKRIHAWVEIKRE